MTSFNTSPYQNGQSNGGYGGYSQQPAFQQRPTPIQGRMINSEDEITPGEIPMDGQVYFFAMRDYSCVIAKAWNASGTIDTVRFVPENTQIQQMASLTQQPPMNDQKMITIEESDYNGLIDRIGKLEEALKDFLK